MNSREDEGIIVSMETLKCRPRVGLCVTLHPQFSFSSTVKLSPWDSSPAVLEKPVTSPYASPLLLFLGLVYVSQSFQWLYVSSESWPEIRDTVSQNHRLSLFASDMVLSGALLPLARGVKQNNGAVTNTCTFLYLKKSRVSQ